jgi:hypothetical protein
MNFLQEPTSPPRLKRTIVPKELYQEVSLNPYARSYKPRACKKGLNPYAQVYVFPTNVDLDAAATLVALRKNGQ